MGHPDIEKTPYHTIQPVDDAHTPFVLPQRQRRQWEKLGVYNVWVLFLGTLVVLLTFGFLAFLWVVSRQYGLNVENISNRNHPLSIDEPPYLWTLILRKDWTARAVTFSTVVVRVAIAAQLAVFAALMAALILENVGASAEDLPLLSMIRCANTGPQALIWNILHTITKGTQIGYSIIILITIVNALALQFMSTILLADFGSQYVVLEKGLKEVPWGINNTNAPQSAAGNDFWRSTQLSYPSFAEYKEGGSAGANYVDTGFTYRGFLPFANSSHREALKSYAGPMTVVDERVVCVKPKLTDIVYSLPQDADDTLAATLDFNDIHPDIVQQDTVNTKINCTMPYRPEEEANFWHASLCRLEYRRATMKQGMLPDSNERRFNETNVWLIFNVTGPSQFNWTGLFVNKSDWIQFPMREISSPEGPWGKLNATNITIDVSACIFNPEPEVYDIEASVDRTTTVLDGLVYWWQSNNRFETSDLRRLLGALGKDELAAVESMVPEYKGFLESNEGRGVMTMKKPADWQAAKFEAKAKIPYHRVIHGALEKLRPYNYLDNGQTKNDSFILTPNADGPDAIHRKNMWLAQDIFTQTNNPALAMQALSHIILQTAYYDWFDSYDLFANTTISETVIRSIPKTYKHILAVSCLLFLHFVLLTQALFLFLTRTDMSLLGNAWQAVSQVSSSDTASAFHHGTMATDQEVLHAAKSSGLADTTVVIRRSERSGRLEATSLKPNH